MDSNQNFPNDEDLQLPFVGGPKMCPTNPRWRTATILKNRKSPYLLNRFLPIWWNLAR